MQTLLVGFDSAWTYTNNGAIVGVLLLDDGTLRCLGAPQIVNYRKAEVVRSRTLLGQQWASGTEGCSRPTPTRRGCSLKMRPCGCF